MLVLRVTFDEGTSGRFDELSESLPEQVTGPLTGFGEISGIEAVHYAPDDRSAIVPLELTTDLDTPDLEFLGRSVHTMLTEQFEHSPWSVQVYMAAPSPERCLVCGQVNGHDWSKHVQGLAYETGLTEL